MKGSISELSLDTRTMNVLKALGLSTSEDVLNYSGDQLIKNSAIGFKRCAQIGWSLARIMYERSQKSDLTEEKCAMFLLSRGYTLAKSE